MDGSVAAMVISSSWSSRDNRASRVAALISVYPADITLHTDSIRLEWLLRRATHYCARAHVELRSVPRARHRRFVQCAFVQRPSLVRALGLRGTDASRDVEHGHGAYQQR